jgi:adenylosuccinate lyase
MAEIWAEQRKLETWLKVELAIVKALADLGFVPPDAARTIQAKATFDLARVRQIEEVTKHDVLAFVECVGERLGEDSRYFHMGVTSSDILDTSLALLIRAATHVVLEELGRLREVIAKSAATHADTLTVGRTHGVHAEPTSLGLKFAVWWTELGRAIGRIEAARDHVCVGKVSGSVGNYSHLSPQVEQLALEALELRPERPATQVVQRDRHAHYVSAVALAGCTLEKIGVELRNLQRTEIAEVEEPLTGGQKGSSSMPHKRNPITLERICGLSRLLRAYAVAAMENVALWHERDISHSSVERVIIPDCTTLLHYMARCLVRVLEGLRIDVGRMRANLDLTAGMIYSQRLMLKLAEAGWARRRAYEKVQRLSVLAGREGLSLKDVTGQDEEIMTVLGPDVLAGLFDPRFYITHVHEILRGIGLEE